jgi:long-chain acyl-CoA synthetase
MSSSKANTLAKIFWNAAAMRGDKVWMRQKDLGIWRSWTWRQTAGRCG